MTQKTGYGHWTGPEFHPDDYFGFIYMITNTLTDQKYIGQKQLHFKFKRPPLKGRKNKRHATKESDWREYTGSSKQLNEDIDKHGKKHFTFEILELYDSKWELSYYENKMIYDKSALLKEEYYNQFAGRIGRTPNKLKI